jgi:hypothetical protein
MLLAASTFVRIGTSDIYAYNSILSTLQSGIQGPEILKQAELQEVPNSDTLKGLMFHSQFRQIFVHIGSTPDQRDKALAYPHDIEAIEKCPVLLAFQSKDEVQDSMRICPPAEHGTIGIVYSGETTYVYNISELPQDVQDRQKQLGQMLDEADKQHDNLKVRDYLSFHMFNKDVEVRDMIQQLAQDYYQHHKSLQKKDNPPHAVNPFEGGNASASTCTIMQLFTYATQNAIAGGTRWKKPKDHRPHFAYNGNIIEYGESDMVITDEIATSLWEQVKQQNYTVVDMATFAISLCARSLEPDHSAWVYAEKFLESRGLQKSTKLVKENIKRTAGYRPENYKETEQSIFHLEKLWMTINQEIDEQEYNPKTKKRNRRKFTYKGRFIVVKGVLTQKDLGTTDSEMSKEVAWHIAPGDWLKPFLEYPNRQIANLSDRVLGYDPKNQKWEKGLGYYFFFNGHMNSKGSGCTFNRHVDLLLKTCSLDEDIERGRPQRTRDRFEKAMNKLVEDRLIDTWYYTDHRNGYIPAKRSWIDEWLELKVTIVIAPEKDLLP